MEMSEKADEREWLMGRETQPDRREERRLEQGYPGVKADPSSPHSIGSEDGKIAVPTGPEKDRFLVFRCPIMWVFMQYYEQSVLH